MKRTVLITGSVIALVVAAGVAWVYLAYGGYPLMMGGVAPNVYGMMHSPAMMPGMLYGHGMPMPGMLGGIMPHWSAMVPGMMSVNLFLMPIVYLLALVGLVLGALWLARSANSASPLAILQTRYARGEISLEQFDAMRKELAT